MSAKHPDLMSSFRIQDNWPLNDPLPSYGRGREQPGGRYMSFINGDGIRDVIITGASQISNSLKLFEILPSRLCLGWFMLYLSSIHSSLDLLLLEAYKLELLRLVTLQEHFDNIIQCKLLK